MLYFINFSHYSSKVYRIFKNLLPIFIYENFTTTYVASNEIIKSPPTPTSPTSDVTTVSKDSENLINSSANLDMSVVKDDIDSLSSMDTTVCSMDSPEELHNVNIFK